MQEKLHITINITTDEIRSQLQKMLASSPHAKLISQVIVGNLSTTEVGLEQLYKAFTGIHTPLKYSLLQEVWIDYDASYSWKMDKKEMTDAGLVHQGRIKATILQIDQYREKPYRVSHNAIKDGVTEVLDTLSVSETKVHPKDEYPLNQ